MCTYSTSSYGTCDMQGQQTWFESCDIRFRHAQEQELDSSMCESVCKDTVDAENKIKKEIGHHADVTIRCGIMILVIPKQPLYSC